MAFVPFCAACFVLFVVFFLAATLLRAATSLANRVIGPIKTEPPILWGDWDSDDDDEIVVKGDERAIPEPGLGRGMFITFLAMVASLVAGYVVRGIIESDELGIFDDDVVLLVAAVLGSLAGFVTLILLLTGMLGTRVKWAALAAFFMFAILVGLVVFAIVVVKLVLG